MSKPATSHRRLPEGEHEIVEPIRLSGLNPKLSGKRRDGELVTRIRRGRLPDGRLYDGVLIEIEDATKPVLKDLIVDGARFSASSAGIEDARHPLTSDRTAPNFMCASALPEPDCYEPRNFLSDMSPDISVRASSGGEFVGLQCDNAIRIGVSIGPDVTGLRLSRCRVSRAGDYGVWMGFGGPLDDPKLPLDPAYRAHLPQNVTLEDVTIAHCGAAGIFIEALEVSLIHCRLVANCCDAPYDDEGGQLTADYKSDGVHVRDSDIIGAPCFVRRRTDGQTVLLGGFGIEGSGSGLVVENTFIEGNSREGVQLIGARNVVFCRGSRILNNHLAQHRWPGYPGSPARHNLSVTTTSEFSNLGAVAANVTLTDSLCENGVCVWSNGSVDQMRLDGLTVRDCDLSGPDHDGVDVGEDGAGGSVAGSGWDIR